MQQTKNLSAKEIEYLFDYCKSQQLKYYDVQLEVVDHMAAAIEKLSDHDLLTFDEAFYEMKKQFNASTFKTIVNCKQKYIFKKIVRLFWEECASFLRWPKLLVVISLAICLSLMPVKIDGTGIFNFSSLAFLIYYLVSFWFHGGIIIKNRTENIEWLLSLQVLSFCMGGFVALVSILSNLSALFENVDIIIRNAELSKFLCLLYLVVLISFQLAGIKLHKQIRRQYPQVFQ